MIAIRRAATQDAPVIGRLICALGAFGVITELYVAPRHRSAGVAQSLLDAAAALGRERGWAHLEVGAPRRERKKPGLLDGPCEDRPFWTGASRWSGRSSSRRKRGQSVGCYLNNAKRELLANEG